MRFKLLKKLAKKNALRWSQADQTFRMAADWRKMKRGGAFTVPFPKHSVFEAMRYTGFAPDGSPKHVFTASHVLRWHVDLRGTAKGNIFAPTGAPVPTRTSFQAWLRAAFSHLLTGNDKETAALVGSITPHSFRAGMASDLERERVPRLHIKKIGRWESDKAMEQYARDGLAQRLQRLTYRSVVTRQGDIQAAAVAARPKKRAQSSDDEFGSSSEEAQGA